MICFFGHAKEDSIGPWTRSLVITCTICIDGMGIGKYIPVAWGTIL